MYAIVRTGGKQYRVEEGRSITVERLPAEEGATVELQDVLLIADDGNVTVGTPVIDGARVLAQVEANGRGPKIIVFKYKSKVRTRKKTGHRQAFTLLAVQEILRPGEEAKTKVKPRRRAKAAEPEAVEAVEAVEMPAAVEAPAEAAPKRRTRKAAPVAEAAPKQPRARRATKPAEGDKPAPRRRAAKPKKETE